MNYCMRMLELWIIPVVFSLALLTWNDVVFSLVPTTTIQSSLPSRWRETLTATEQKQSSVSHQRRREYSRHDMAAAGSSTQLKFSDDKIGLANFTIELISSRYEDIFSAGSKILTMKMDDHRSLGCTVEESLHKEDDFIFISKLTAHGCAERAGLQVGDVITGVTGSFGRLTDVLDAKVEKFKQLVSAVPDEDPLMIQVVRGTNVLERHESAVVDLCNLSRENEKEVEDCVVSFLSGAYDYDDDNIDDDDVSSSCESDEDTECIIDNMMNLWADDLPLPPTLSGITELNKNERTAKKPKPWSSRSSPSGTWVRDPKTGKMRNIDK